jgi:hypothetical protein
MGGDLTPLVLYFIGGIMSRLKYGKGVWVANKDFNLPNLKAKKGEPLPSPWTTGVLRTYLKTHQGKKCIKYVEDYFINEEDKGLTNQLKKKVGRPPKPLANKEAVVTA